MSSMKVLIVDDNESITEVVKDYFEYENIECVTVNDGRDGLDEIQTNRYDLILLDIAIPGYSGIDILNELDPDYIEKNNIIIFTASVFKSEDVEKFLKMGIKDVCVKPISLESLDTIKEKYLAN
ncbi:MAG TPA: response regulator [Candidatus Saccharimonadales bacterium]|nr:response regulator [Candidatus Saccharimonadales bacterium]